MRATHEIERMVNKYQMLQAKVNDSKSKEIHGAIVNVLNWAKDKETKDIVGWICKLELRRNPEDKEYLSDAREKQLQVLYWVADIDGLEAKIEKFRKGADTVVTYSSIAYSKVKEMGSKISDYIRSS